MNASTSSRNVGRSVQPGPWNSASNSAYGKSSRCDSNRARVVLPAPLVPPTITRSTGLMPCVVPGATDAHGDVERDVEVVGAAHLVAHELLDLRLLARGDLQDELVVHLKQQPGPQALLTQAALNAEHGDLDDVGGTALDRRVESHPLRHLAPLAVVAGEVRQVATAAEDRLGVPVHAGLVDDTREVVAHPAETVEVGVHLLACLVGGDAELLRKAVRRQAIGQAVGHGLDPAT